LPSTISRGFDQCLATPDTPGGFLSAAGIGLEIGTVYAALGTKIIAVEFTDGLLPTATATWFDR
jgi:hypothetical protein